VYILHILVNDLSSNDVDENKTELQVSGQYSNHGPPVYDVKHAIYEATPLPLNISELIAQFGISSTKENLAMLEQWFNQSNKEQRDLIIIPFLIIGSSILTSALDLSMAGSTDKKVHNDFFNFAMATFMINFATAGQFMLREITPFTNKCSYFYQGYRLETLLRKQLSAQLQVPLIYNSENRLQKILKKNTLDVQNYLQTKRKDFSLRLPSLFLLALFSGTFPFLLAVIAVCILPGPKEVEASTIVSSSIHLALASYGLHKSRLGFYTTRKAQIILSDEFPDYSALIKP